MDEDPVQPGQDLLALGLEGLGEGDVGGHRKESLVIDLGLDPVHEEGDVLGGRQVHWFLVLHSILPQVFKFSPS